MPTVYLTIRAARDDRRVAVREAHPDHPDGEIWVTGDGREHTAALTREVARRIGDGSVVVVGLSPLQVDPDSAIAGRAETGGAPLELGEQIGGPLPPRGDETPLPAPARAKRGGA